MGLCYYYILLHTYYYGFTLLKIAHTHTHDEDDFRKKKMNKHIHIQHLKWKTLYTLQNYILPTITRIETKSNSMLLYTTIIVIQCEWYAKNDDKK